MKKTKYFVVAKKWFDKINGNTYYNAKIIDDNGQTVLYTGFAYGYGKQYLDDASKQLKKFTKNFDLIDLGESFTKKTILKNNNF